MLLPLEARIVLAACGLRSRHGAPLDTLLTDDVDWAAVERLAQIEKATPILARALRPHLDRVPAETAATLRTREIAHSFRSLAFEAAMARVLRQFSDLDVPALLLKGAALGRTVYTDPQDRPMADLDLLLPPDRARAAWEMLIDRGWTQETEGRDAFFAQHQHLPPLVHPTTTGVIVEIHHHLSAPDLPFEINQQALWRDAEKVAVADQVGHVLGPVHQLYHLCLHFAWSHQMRRGIVRTARDCQALITARDVDWDRFTAVARERGAASLCFWTLDLVRRVADVPVPAQVLRSLRRAGHVRCTGVLRRGLLATAFPVARAQLPSVAAAQALWTAAVRPKANGFADHRPWDGGVRILLPLVRTRPLDPRRKRVLNAVRRAPRWLRFAARLVPGR